MTLNELIKKAGEHRPGLLKFWDDECERPMLSLDCFYDLDFFIVAVLVDAYEPGSKNSKSLADAAHLMAMAAVELRVLADKLGDDATEALG